MKVYGAIALVLVVAILPWFREQPKPKEVTVKEVAVQKDDAELTQLKLAFAELKANYQAELAKIQVRELGDIRNKINGLEEHLDATKDDLEEIKESVVGSLELIDQVRKLDIARGESFQTGSINRAKRMSDIEDTVHDFERRLFQVEQLISHKPLAKRK